MTEKTSVTISDTLHIHTAADPRSTTARDFMSGVRLFDKALEEAERVFKREDVWFLASTRSDAGGRGVVPLNVFLRPVLTELTANPRFADGFAAALGDYLVTLNNGVVSGPGRNTTGSSTRRSWGQCLRRVSATARSRASVTAKPTKVTKATSGDVACPPPLTTQAT